MKASSQFSRLFSIGTTEEIFSEILGEKRTLNICLPDGYHPYSAKTYPVIYLLDGSANEDFIHISGLVQFFTLTGAMPPTLVVGIANVDRKRDFTFPTTLKADKEAFSTTGSSAKFTVFLEKELIPYLSGRFRTNHQNTLIGQSLGGLLATEILLKNLPFSTPISSSVQVCGGMMRLFSNGRQASTIPLRQGYTLLLVKKVK